MKLAGVVILFNPIVDVLQNILSYKDKVNKLYVIDNSEQTNVTFQRSFENNLEVSFIHDGKNEGISKRINQAAKQAIDDGFDWLLTMDQDSYFEKDGFNNYLLNLKEYNNLNDVAMVGIEHNEEKFATTEGSFINTTLLITSGSIINLQIYKEIGGFDDNLFIDHVDHEYCLRATLRGFKIIKWNKSLLHHSIGEKSFHRSLKNFKLSERSLHSPLRLYYMVRNYLYLQSIYQKHFEKELKLLRGSLFHEIKNNILYNKRKAIIINYILKGFFDFKKGKMGKITFEI